MVFKRRVLNVLFILFLLIFIGTVFYHNIEGWRYLDSVYFTVVTMTTIGYGDFTPQTDIGKIFTIFFIFSGIATAFYTITLITKYIYKIEFRTKLKETGGIIKIKN